MMIEVKEVYVRGASIRDAREGKTMRALLTVESGDPPVVYGSIEFLDGREVECRLSVAQAEAMCNDMGRVHEVLSQAIEAIKTALAEYDS